MGASNWIHVDVNRIEAGTDKAFLLDIEELDEMLWVPKSVISDPDDYVVGQVNCTVSIQEWWIEKNEVPL